MRFRLRTLMMTVAAIAILIVFVPVGLRQARSVLLGYDYSMQRNFDELEVGDSLQTAHKHFGEPWAIETAFPRIIGYRESDFPAADLGHCIEFVTWNNGINCYYCLGIDENGKIVLKVRGNP